MRVFITCQNKTHKKLVATVKRCEGVYNRTGEPSVTFLHKKVEAKRTLLRRGADGGSRTRTVLPPTDFESVTSANSITSA